ncbi:MAG TPA: hypothetical protein VG758_03925 [Hyphomicrobiaceae bacterium]|jgi:archaemetzincin|nr:hypothetical protein [Hyphomicrobiaceae bacterium]
MTGTPRITLLPVGNPDRRALGDLARGLEGMGFDVELAGRRALPRGAFDARRGQFHADTLLGLALSVRAMRVLAVTDVDLYAGDLNFVFGTAQPSGEACVISLFRLYLDADAERFRGRALKEAMHELGHTFGLGHCPDPGCVMWFSNTLEETDRKKGRLLPPVQGGAARAVRTELAQPRTQKIWLKMTLRAG